MSRKSEPERPAPEVPPADTVNGYRSITTHCAVWRGFSSPARARATHPATHRPDTRGLSPAGRAEPGRLAAHPPIIAPLHPA